MIRTTQKAFAIHIEGVSVGGSDDGTLFVSEDLGSSFENYDLHDVNTGLPGTVAASANFFTGEYNLSSSKVSLDADAIVRGLFADAARDAVAELFVERGAFTTTFFVSPPGSLTAGQVIYIADEAFRVDSIPSTDPLFETVLVTRNIAKTSSVDMAAGEPIYADPPYYRSRYVRFFICTLNHDRTAIVSIEQYGAELIHNHKTDDCHNEIIVDCRDSLAAASNGEKTSVRQISPGVYDVRVENRRHAVSGRISRPGNYVGLTTNPSSTMFFQLKHADFGSRIVQAHYVPQLTGENFVFEKLVFDTTANAVYFDGPASLIYNPQPMGGDFEYLPTDTEVTEILYYARGLGGTNLNHAFAGHPVALALSFLLSTGEGNNNPQDPDSIGFLTFDTLAGDLGLGIPNEQIDIASFVDCIKQYPVEFDQVLMGLDGNSIERQRAIVDWPRSYGFYYGRARDGRLTCHRWGAISMETLCDIATKQHNVIMLPPKMPIDFLDHEGLFRLSSKVGDNAIVKGYPISTLRLASNRAERRIASGNSDFYDYSTVFKSRWRWALQQLQQYARARRNRPPVIQIKVPLEHFDNVGGFTSGVCPSIGEYVRILRAQGDAKDRIKALGPDGDKIDPNSDAGFLPYTGIVVGSKIDIRCGDATLDVFLIGWRQRNIVRQVAPSGCIESVSGSVVTLRDPDDLVAADGTPGFSVGDDVRFMTDDMQIYCEPGECFEIGSIDSTGLIITLATPLLGGAIPNHVNRLELCDVSNYSNFLFCGSETIPAAFDLRKFAFIVDADGDLNGFDPDVYGL